MKHTDETKKKLSDMRKGERNPFFGHKHTDATKARIATHSRAIDRTGQFNITAQTITVPTNLLALGYLAGLVDGEGTIGTIAPTKRRGETARIAVYNNNTDVMAWLCRIVGGASRLSDRRGRVPGYTWQIAAVRDVYVLCKALLPCLIIKRANAQSVIDFLETKYGERISNG